MSRRRVILAASVALFVAAQFVPVDRTNPAGGEEISAPAGVAAALERSCYDCHSNRTDWPWYSSIAPVSWLVTRDVSEGRERLNFSRWREYSAKERNRLAERAVEEVSEGAMPIKIYLLLHRGAKVGGSELELLRAWAREERAAGGAPDSR